MGELSKRRLVAGIALLALLALLAWWLARPAAPPRSAVVPSSTPSAQTAASPRRARALRVRGGGARRIDLSTAEATVSDGIGRIEGSVLSRGDGRGVPRARLIFDDGSLHTVSAGADGSFSFAPPRVGVYELALVSADGFLSFSPEYGHSPIVFTARRGAGLRGARIHLTPAVDYTVTVLSPDDPPVPVSGARVGLVGGSAAGASLADASPTWTTDAEGRAEVHAADGAILEATYDQFAPGRAQLDFAAQVSHALTIRLRARDETNALDADLSGHVVADGEPVPDALVVLSLDADNPAKGEAALIPDLRATTDDSGRFAFEGLVRGRYAVAASAPGLAPNRIRGVIAPAHDVTIELRTGASLLGKVTQAETGEAVPSFVVIVREPVSALLKELVVAEPNFDPDGEYAIPALPAGTFLVTVSAHGFAPSPEREIVIGDDEVRADFSLTRGATVTGTVIDAVTKEPLEGAKASLEGSFGESRSVRLFTSSRTDAQGRFQLLGVAPGLQAILVAAAHHHGKLVSVTGVAGQSQDITVELTPTEEGEEPRIELAGIGAVLAAKEDYLVIGRVIDGGGAAEVGLAPDDAILAVDGVLVVDLGFAGSIMRIRGPVGSTVELLVRKANSSEAVTLSVVRRKIRS